MTFSRNDDEKNINNETDMQSNADNEQNILENQIKDCNEQLTKAHEKFLYLNAEFDNFKRRSEKEKIQWISNSQTYILTDLLPIIDDFERAFSQNYKEKLPQEVLHYFTGFELIYKNLQKFLKKHGIEEILDITEFDPVKHEAIMQVDSDIHSSEEIVTVLEKGYMYKGQVLRPAKVSVAR